MFTYENVAINPKDQVRFLIGDTNSSKVMYQDEEINWALSQTVNIYTCAAELVEQFVSKLGGSGSGGAIKQKKISEFSITYDIAHLQTLASSLRARSLGHQIPYAGGISVADKQQAQNNADWVQPKVERGLGDNPQAPAPETPSVNPLTTI